MNSRVVSLMSLLGVMFVYEDDIGSLGLSSSVCLQKLDCVDTVIYH